MMYSCKHVSRLVSDSFERKLGFFEKLQFNFHLRMCRLCARHKREMEGLRELIKKRLEDEVCPGEDERLSPEARQRIQQVLDTLK